MAKVFARLLIYNMGAPAGAVGGVGDKGGRMIRIKQN
jgi:hypothetical protein